MCQVGAQVSNTEWQNDQSAPYRQQHLIQPEPTGHPLLDQIQGQLLDLGTKVTVYEKRSDGSWAGCMRVVIRSSLRTSTYDSCVRELLEIAVREFEDYRP